MEATGLWCIVGNLVKVGVQLGLLTIVDFDESLTAMGWYVFIWILSQVFGICSTLASMFLYPGFLPTYRLGELNGLKNSLLSTVNCITPSQAGPKRARVVFLVTGLEFAMATQTVPARPKSG